MFGIRRQIIIIMDIIPRTGTVSPRDEPVKNRLTNKGISRSFSERAGSKTPPIYHRGRGGEKRDTLGNYILNKEI